MYFFGAHPAGIAVPKQIGVLGFELNRKIKENPTHNQQKMK